MEVHFSTISQLSYAHYHTTIPWSHLRRHITSLQEDFGSKLDLDPVFQRQHVWSREQQTKYVEFMLRGGRSGRDILCNCAGWMGTFKGPYVLVDGKQRVNAALLFLEDRVPAFGSFYSEFADKLPFDVQFNWYVNDLATQAEVLQWYLDFNSGGTVHTEAELDRVRSLLRLAR
jgi:hypothetical protein